MSDGLSDYKIHCFNGQPKIILVCRNRFTKSDFTENFYEQNWTHLYVQREKHGNSNDNIKQPKELTMMLKYAAQLSVNIPFLRTDFYEINGRLYFGKLTFYPASGFEIFVPESFDRKAGSWITLPDNTLHNGRYC